MVYADFAQGSRRRPPTRISPGMLHMGAAEVRARPDSKITKKKLDLETASHGSLVWKRAYLMHAKQLQTSSRRGHLRSEAASTSSGKRAYLRVESNIN